MTGFIPCTEKYLPPELAIVAAETAVRQNPANLPMVSGSGLYSVLSPGHMAVLTGKKWGVGGVRLTVGFMEQVSAALANKILKYANKWGEDGNVTFVLSNTDPQVRITLEGGGYWSFLGSDILHIPKNDPTMSLHGFTLNTPDSEYERVVIHEFGHTLGAPHEHMRSAIVRRIDTQKAIDYFRRTQGWSAEMVMQQVLTPLSERSLFNAPDADENSIMTYSLPGSITIDGRPILGGNTLAPQDRTYIGQIYPKATDPNPPPPPPPVSDKHLDMSMDFQRKQVHIRLPAGWSVHKKALLGEDMSKEPTTAEMTALADKLEALLPATGAPREAAMQAPASGLISSILSVITALRSGDWKASLVAVRDLLNLIIGDDGTIQFQAEAAAFGFDWSSLFKIIFELLLSRFRW